MMTLVARLIDSQSAAVGWFVHLCIAAFLGLLFALLSGRPQLLVAAVGQGLLWGFLWWILGGLILLPLRIGEDLLVLNSMSWRSLGGHLAYTVPFLVWCMGSGPKACTREAMRSVGRWIPYAGASCLRSERSGATPGSALMT